MDFKARTILFCLLFVSAVKGQTALVEVPINGITVLPVHLNTILDKSSIEVDWIFHGTPVISFKSGKPVQGENYVNRAFLFEDKLGKGDLSLKLMNVTEKDAGKYTCIAEGENISKTEFVSLVLHVDITATTTGTTILPVHLRTHLDKPNITVVWKFKGIKVGSFLNGKPDINDNYKNKASFFENEITKGNISLKLRDVTEDDFGNYTCVFHDPDSNKKKIIVFLVRKAKTDSIGGMTTPTPEPDQEGGKNIGKKDAGRIAGGVLGVILGLVIVAGIGAAIYRWYRRTRANPARPGPGPEPAPQPDQNQALVTNNDAEGGRPPNDHIQEEEVPMVQLENQNAD